MEDIVNRAEICMRHLASEQYLMLKASLGLLIGRKLRKDHLQGNMHVLKKTVFSLIHLTHSPAGNETNDDESIRDNVATNKTAQPCCAPWSFGTSVP